MAFKRVATEGATTDGREISRQWIQQMAENYDPQKYGARISLEHIRGVLPDSPFKSYGDVRALKAAENADGKLELYADMDPTDELKAMVKNRQKVYSSIEVEPNFAKTGTAYLTGLAVTDTPASLGTEMLSFSAQQGVNSPLASRKHTPTALFSAAVEISDPTVADRQFDGQSGAGAKSSLTDRIAALFSRKTIDASATRSDISTEVEAGMQLFAERHQALEAKVDALPDKEKFDQMFARVNEMYAALDNLPDTPRLTPALGGDGGTEQTDC